MKQISTFLVASIFLMLPSARTKAQCTATITGANCIPTVLSVNHNVSNANTIEWYKDGALYQIRGKYNPVAETVSSGWPLAEPQDMCGDNSGNLYVVDGVSNSVVKIAAGSSTGIIVAGGNGKGSALNQFASPQSVAVDAEGNLYVSDALMNRVTKWTPGSTEGITVAGSNTGAYGSAANLLSAPKNICIDADGNLFIADRFNHRIQKWAPGASVGVTVAGGNGNGIAENQISESMDVGVDAMGNVYVADYFNNRISKWAPGASTGVTVAGGGGSGNTANKFNFTTALHVMPNGDFYVRDQANYRIQKYTPGALYGTTVAGGFGSSNTLTWGFGLYVDVNENIFVPALFDDKVDKYSTSAVCDVNLDVYQTGNYTAKLIGDCTAESTVKNMITIPERPSAIKGPSNVTEGQQGVIYRVENMPGLVYTWAVPQDATIARGQGKSAIKVNYTFSSGYITVIASNECGQSILRKKFITLSAPLAIATKQGNKGLSMYPNPVKNMTTIQFDMIEASNYNIQIFDLSGRLIQSNSGVAFSGANKVQLNLSNLVQGSYIIKLISADKVSLFTQTFVKE